MDMLRKCFRALRWVLMILVACLSGCGGCRRDQNLSREEIERRAKEQREALELGELLTLPIDGQAKFATVKAGHWFESQQQFKSNREDLQVVSVGDLTRNNEAIKLPGTNMTNEYSRRTSLPKGQTKQVELQFFIPEATSQQDTTDVPKKVVIRSQLRSWPLMTPLLQAPKLQPTYELKRHEYQMVVVSPQALNYEFLSILDAVRWSGDDLSEMERTRSYHVALVKPQDGKYTLPRSMLTMTSIAVLVWDDVSTDEVDDEQKKAIIDWLHWGGQLIISGPGSWSRLQNSFLSPYLPAQVAEAAEFTSTDFETMSNTWRVPDRTKPEMTPLTITGPPVGGLRFQLSNGGQWLPGSGELVAERQIGRGRVVVTAFPLRDQRIYRWKYFSNFLSTGLLRRLPREVRVKDNVPVQSWSEPFTSFDQDARLHSQFRIAARDLATADTQSKSDLNAKFSEEESIFEPFMWGPNSAAWNDYSGVAVQAKTALRLAAGIELPERSTILKLLVAYLVILVPVNWLVFKLIGRLEYAWIAAPILSMIAVVVVTRVARLDIGFARRNTEIAVMELYGGHDRAHLSRFIALYTSLSTNYAVEFPESGSVVLPWGDIGGGKRRDRAEVRNLRTNYGQSTGVVLEPMTVYSNSTELLHAEQMVSLGGTIRLDTSQDGKWKLVNGTEMPLQSAIVVRNDQGKISYAWLPKIEGKSSESIDFVNQASDSIWQYWNRQPDTWIPQDVQKTPAVETDGLWIGGLLHELVRKSPLIPGQTRLFAFTDNHPGELTITPKEDQFEGRCVLVAHLSASRLPGVRPDKNIASPSLLTPELTPEDPDAQAEENVEPF